MISVGIDVSKGKSTIYVLKPYGEIVCSPFEIQHVEKYLEDFHNLLEKLDREIRIVMEATGIYHLPVLTFLHDKGYFVSVINPFAMKKYAKDNNIRGAKIDKFDSIMITNYGIEMSLEEGTYTDAEKLEHEKIIRHLRFENQTLAKDKERYHHLWRDALTRPDHQIEDLEKEIRALKHANEQLSAQLQEAQNVIAKLKAQMNRDHENSSLPSSVKPFHKKIKNSRIATGREAFS